MTSAALAVGKDRRRGHRDRQGRRTDTWRTVMTDRVNEQVTPSDTKPRTGPTVVREEPHGEEMRAIILKGFGGLDSLVYADIPKPLPKDGEVVIRVKAFGLNHAE